MTNRMNENKKRQKASSIHSSLQSYGDILHQEIQKFPEKSGRTRNSGWNFINYVLTVIHLDILKVFVDQMMKMTDAETNKCL